MSRRSIIRLLLWLWKVLPLPRRLRWIILWFGNTKFLVGVLAAVFDDEGRVLLQCHTYRRRYPWGMPGGWLHGRERPIEALAREVAEETGLTVAVGPLVAALRSHREPNIVLTYLCRATGALRLSVESSEARYFALDALPAGLTPDQIVPIQRAGRLRRHLLERSEDVVAHTLWSSAADLDVPDVDY